MCAIDVCRALHRRILLSHCQQHKPSRGGVRQRDGVLPCGVHLAVCSVVGVLLNRRCQRVHGHVTAAVSRGIVLCRWRASAVPVGKVLGCSGRCRVHDVSSGLLLPDRHDCQHLESLRISGELLVRLACPVLLMRGEYLLRRAHSWCAVLQ